MSTIISKSITDTLTNRPASKVDWNKSPLKEVKMGGKNAVGDYGEHVVKNYYRDAGIDSLIIKKGHDVLAGTKKIEVKTAFQGKAGSFFFNQIYYVDPNTGVDKDWTHLAFVFVRPDSVEIWECERPPNPEEHFNINNGWSWNKNDPKKLTSIWKKIYSEEI